MIQPTEGLRGAVADSIGEIVFDRPDKRNALTPAMLAAMPALIDELVAGGARVLLLRGEGRVWCAGFDLAMCAGEPEDAPDPILAQLLRTLASAAAAVRRGGQAGVPTVIAAHGAAIAGACALACAGDVVVADRAAKFGYPVVTLGISPAVSAPALSAQAGLGAARARLLDPQLITGERAHTLGLVHELVETRDDVLPAARRIAAELAAKPPHALAATKRLLNELDGTADDARRERALATSTNLVGSDEQRDLLGRLWA